MIHAALYRFILQRLERKAMRLLLMKSMKTENKAALLEFFITKAVSNAKRRVMGKYKELRDKLPRFEEAGSFHDKVQEERELILSGADNATDANIERLAFLYGSARINKHNYEALVTGMNARLEALSQLIVEALEDQGLEKITFTSGATGYVQDTPHTTIIDEEAFYKAIQREIGARALDSLLTIHHKKLEGITNERLLAGKAPYAGTAVFIKTQFRLLNKGEKE
jgi:hypothetical protein